MASIAERITDSLGVERNVVAASGAVFLVGLGEELWKKFLPKYLESLGASVAAVFLDFNPVFVRIHPLEIPLS